ncbi:MAG: M42 family metallopeptidase [Clostridiales bacterium]|nr:M42 family metallopeptidase [Clostridiales bacterium]
MTEELKNLCAVSGVSGREAAVAGYIMSKLEGKAQYKVDNLGNIIAFKKGAKRPKNKVMFAAHMDEVGFIITYITDEGFLKFDTVGGINVSVILGKNVLVGKKQLSGVVGVKPVHLLKREDETKYPELDKLYIDIGASSKEEAEAYVSIGDYAYFDSDYTEFGDGLIKARAIDDRAGCALMLEMIYSDLPYDAYFAFTTCEETGDGGAAVAAFTVKPDYAVVLEATTAADIAGVSGEKRVCELGKGPVVSFMDRKTIYPKELYDHIMNTASENGIKAQTKTMIAGGNDAGVIFKSGSGVRVAAVSLPCRYLHSPSCVIKKSDYDETLRLLYAVLPEIAVL